MVRTKPRLLILFLFSAAAFLAPTLVVKAQAVQTKYNVGDRVECDRVSMNEYEPATIVPFDKKYDPPDAAESYYRIRLDSDPNGDAWRCDLKHLRPLQGGNKVETPTQGANNASTAQTEKPRTDENGTLLADRPLLDCDSLNRKGRNGSPPPIELAKKMIRCLIERPSEQGMDGARTMDITDITMGAPHRWRVYVDIGQGTANTLVYPFHVKFNQKTFYWKRIVSVTDREKNVTCFVDATGLWQCGWASGVEKEGKTQEIRVEQ